MSSQHYAPSVPISVYRELAAELQATQSMLDSLNNQNQQLTQQNHRLRLEIDKLVQTSAQVQTVVEAMPQPTWGQDLTAMAAATPPPARDLDPRRDQPLVMVTEQSEHRPGQRSSRSSAELNNLWFVTTMVLIVVSAFGAGFLIVRPFLSNR